MKFYAQIALLIFLLLLANRVTAQDEIVIDIHVGPDASQEIVDLLASMGPEGVRVNVIRDGNSGDTINFGNLDFGNADAAIHLSGDQEVVIFATGGPVIFNGFGAQVRFATLSGNARFDSAGISFQGWSSNGDGGVFLATENSTLDLFRGQFPDNVAQGYGGVIAVTEQARAILTECYGYRNSAQFGGFVSARGNSTVQIRRCGLFDNHVTGFGCTAYIDSDGIGVHQSAFTLTRSQISGPCQNGHIDNPHGKVSAAHSLARSINDALRTQGHVEVYGDFFFKQSPTSGLQANGGSRGKPEALCEDFGSGAIESLGFNLSEDDSCSLDQPSDLENVDGMVADNGTGIFVPQPGSPLIDSGETGTQVFPGDTMESLNCDYKDLIGLGAPQDANNDGVFECDRGAVEVAGPGAMSPGHSSAFFNSLRNGEGQYVEMLNANTAVVFTFTHRPDGSGSAWFTGIGYVLGNSIVIDQLLRPSGTSFGPGFDSSEIVNAFAGGQSMVFNDCEAASPGGNVAYSGNKDLGYEALVTRAERLSNILGCGNLTPHPNAGLSGSYFLPSRNGEGIVVQWLPNGQVLVIFFTYDLNGGQQWVTGIGTADGNSVTMEALYPSSNTSWGSDFDPDEIILSPWGTFELVWTECGGVQFSYNSTVPGYGSATRQYIRLSNLWEATCPDF